MMIKRQDKTILTSRRLKWHVQVYTSYQLVAMTIKLFCSRFVYLINYLCFSLNFRLIIGELCEYDVNHIWNAVTSLYVYMHFIRVYSVDWLINYLHVCFCLYLVGNCIVDSSTRYFFTWRTKNEFPRNLLLSGNPIADWFFVVNLR